VHIENIGFNQEVSVAHRQVDAAVGYAMNEPLDLKERGYRVREFDVYHWANLAGAGIATSDTMIARHPQLVRAFVRATRHGLADTLHDPTAAYRISAAAIKIKLNDRVQRAVLRRAIAFWQPEPGHPLGWVDPRIWSRTARLLYRFKQIPHPVSARSFYTDEFIP
jgi:NitT/TauT family transport system substrate-binding protein